jgi:aspartate racemase
MSYPLIGILGGMGPLASSGFVNFLYQKCQSRFTHEQGYPRIILISDPTIPDRLQSAQKCNVGQITTIFEDKIQELLFLGATQILICCFTAHYFLKWISVKKQKKIIHLGELLNNYLGQKKEYTLILASELLINSQLIDSPFAVYPVKKDLNEIHALIYAIKQNGSHAYKNNLIALARSLSQRYNVAHVLLACTEFHLVYQNITSADYCNNTIGIHDGLNIAADFIIHLS